MSKKRNKNEEIEQVVEVTETDVVVEEAPVEEVVEEPVVETVVEPEPKADPVYVITGCEKLNVRKAASATAEVVCVIDKKAEIVITEDKGGDWVGVSVSGKNGYCMKKFIVLK